MRYCLLLVTFLLSLSASPLAAQQGGRFIDVTDNRGGNVLEMISYRNELERSGKIVRIRGYCRSACTILTTLPNACLGPGARIGFHAPRIPNTQIIPPLVDEIMGQFYRGKIRERWFGGWNRSMKMQVITAQDYVRMDPQARICDSLRRR